MKKNNRQLTYFLFAFVLTLPFYLKAAPLITINGINLTITKNLNLNINGDVVSQKRYNQASTIENSGIIKLSGNWYNNSGSDLLSKKSGLVEFNGYNQIQVISGVFSTCFYNLKFSSTLNNSLIKYKADVNFCVENQLIIENGIMHLNGKIMQCGIDSNTIGSINRLGGWFMGGSIKRWISAKKIQDKEASGHFPLGDSTNYRPIWISHSDTGILCGGIIEALHNSNNQIETISILDDIILFKRPKSCWKISTQYISKGRYNLTILANGYNLNNIEDLRICKDSNVCGTPGINSGNLYEPEAKRTAINWDLFAGNFYVGYGNGSPLPVKWLNYTTKTEKNTVKLNWSTASENNNNYFTIERTRDLNEIEQIASLPGAGYSRDVIFYEYCDYFPHDGYSYYRIKQTDYDGKTESTEWKSAYYKKTEKTLSYTIFPNPTKEGENINIEIECGQESKLSICLIDESCKIQFFKEYKALTGRNVVNLNLEKKLKAGLYQILIYNMNEIYSKKLIVN